MSVVFRKMTDYELKTLYKEGIEHYTQELMEERNFTYENAKLQAIKEFSDILPNGLQTGNNFPMAISEKKVEKLWDLFVFSIKVKMRIKCAIYNFSICEAKRRRRYETAALNIVEQDAAKAGCLVSILFVKDSNSAARALYHKCGYKNYRQDGYGKYMLKDLCNP